VGPTPPAVIIEQQAEVLWNGYTGVTGSAFNPLNQVSPGVGVDCVAIKYSGQSATASVPLPASHTVVLSGLTATATPPVPPYPGGTGVIRASYQANIFPVTLNLVGATKDSSGNYNILVGQGCTASLSGIPAGCTVSNYQWSVTGTTFQSWTADNSHTTEVDGPGPLTNPTASWFWDDQKTAQDKVTCTVTVTPPSGQGLPFSLTVVKPVNVVVPSWTCTGTAGTMQVNTLWGAGNGTDSCLWAGPASGSAKSVGMDWNATLSPLPAPFSGTGTLELVQTETPNSTYISTAGAKYKRSNNGQQGLDTFYPYPWVQSPSPYESNDSPGIDLTALSAASGQLQYQFVDCLMFKPPGSSQYVPLATYSWSTPASSTASLTPAGTTPFTASNAFPSWPQNVGNGTWSWIPQ